MPRGHDCFSFGQWKYRNCGILSYVRQPFECLASRGGVIAMRPLLIHSSSRARVGEPRRVLHIEYAESMHLGKDIHLALA